VETDVSWAMLIWKLAKAGSSGGVLVFTVLSTSSDLSDGRWSRSPSCFLVYPLFACCFGAYKLIFQHHVLAVMALLI
jgi:hypothetical protein